MTAKQKTIKRIEIVRTKPVHNPVFAKSQDERALLKELKRAASKSFSGSVKLTF